MNGKLAFEFTSEKLATALLQTKLVNCTFPCCWGRTIKSTHHTMSEIKVPKCSFPCCAIKGTFGTFSMYVCIFKALV